MARKSRKESAKAVVQEAVSTCRAALYVRLSVEDSHTHSASIETQQMIIAQFLERNPDIQVYDTYIDNGTSGTTFHRPAFQKMLSDIESGFVNCVIVNNEQASEYIETINKMYESKDLVFYHIHDGIEFHGEDYILQDAPHERNTKDFDFLTYELTFKEVIRISGKQKANPSNSENSGFRNFGFNLPSEDNSPNIYYLSASE